MVQKLRGRLASMAGILALLGTTVLPQPARAQAIPVAGAAAAAVIGKMTVSDAMKKLNEMLASATLQVNNTFNLNLGTALTALQASMQGLNYMMSKQRDAIVNDLDDERKFAMFDAYNLANDLSKKIIPASIAQVNIDALNLLGHINFIGKNTPFLIANITPTVLTYKQDGDWEVHVLGIGIGNQEGIDIPTKVTLTFPDKVSVVVPNFNEPSGINFAIQHNILADKFLKNDPANVIVTISAIVTSSCWLLFTCHTPRHFDYRMWLFPRVAVHGVLSQFKLNPGTDPATRIIHSVMTTSPNGDGNDTPPVGWATPPFTADPGYSIVKVALTGCDNAWNKSGNVCAYTNIFPQTMVATNNVVTIQGTQHSWPVTLHFDIAEEKIIFTPESLSDTIYDFSAGETKPVMVSGKAGSALITIKAANGTNDVIQILPSPSGGIGSALWCTNKTDVGTDFRYLCHAQPVDYY